MKRTILYIDDEVGCLNIFEEMFGDEYDVRTAATLVLVQLFVPKPWMAVDMSRMLERACAHFESGGGGR